ncbi:glutathione peroxidase [Cocleimonas sp. KMM 6892]|uniref:glutathione peroxidase n=1 Tax=unclassified Cocleimonas TaxID=2639732 RepID=UPI002DBAE354|nr:MULTISPECIES: glutathione peroxidase [unclassified Cocleimonas]MEB8431567.1 glutathione peroxidase [Cocleimonas sp. KMM 6892]MEC4713661.1 glutathione peroxidase [Cocleimonas sp. KMM 6895]MEC4742992.1 glutathione peroxidase [Cocleimonas sp. KMM 6896]
MNEQSINNPAVSQLFKVSTLLALLLGFALLIPFFSIATAKTISAPVNSNGCPATLDFDLRKLAKSDEVNLCEEYKGKVVLIVNTASKCGFTGQFDGLEALYKKYQDKGLVVLGFPSNDFANQDPENEKNIAKFCRLTYGVKFPMFQKTHAAESNASPIYKTLGKMAGEFPQWNFHKYVLDTNGNLIGSFKSQITPESKEIVSLIEKHLP